MKIIFTIFLSISSLYSFLIQPESSEMLNFTHVLFEWEQEPKAVEYNFQLSDTENFIGNSSGTSAMDNAGS